MVTFSAVIKMGFGIVGDTIAGDIAKTFAVHAFKAIGTSIATGAAMIDIGLNIGVHTVAISRRYG
jgi:hypothetical protein